MRILNMLVDRQEELGLRLVEVYPQFYELRDENEIIVVYAGKPPKEMVIKDGWNYLKRKV